AVARKTPPARPTSSPMTITSGSRASSTCSASLTASTTVSSAIAQVGRRIDVRVREQELGIGGRLGLGRGDAGAHQVLSLLARAGDDVVAQQADPLQEALVLPDALACALLLDARLIDVRAGVVG